jgi:pimeloyl-ACP methyl ester carboxylesterase
VTVNGVSLNYLDWGGSGPTLVLIHGLTDSPHIFDDFAASLKDSIHVIAYSRRGHGQSDAPPGPYDEATLVEDLHLFLDDLAIKRAILLGWSMGGNEITDFAGRYPERVEGLIYLEAGYDWSDPKFQTEYPSIKPDASAFASLDAYRTWYRQTWFGNTPWTPGLEAYLRDIVRIETDGKIHPVPSGPVLEALLASNANSHRDYGKVRAPALAFYFVISSDGSFRSRRDARKPGLGRPGHDRVSKGEH